MVDFDQENVELWKDLVKTKDGIDHLAQYSSAVGRRVLIQRCFMYLAWFKIKWLWLIFSKATCLCPFRFPSAPGDLLCPIYGEGELTQAFCCRASVKGCIYLSFKGFMRPFLKISKYLNFIIWKYCKLLFCWTYMLIYVLNFCESGSPNAGYFSAYGLWYVYTNIILP